MQVHVDYMYIVRTVCDLCLIYPGESLELLFPESFSKDQLCQGEATEGLRKTEEKEKLLCPRGSDLQANGHLAEPDIGRYYPENHPFLVIQTASS